MMNKIKPLSLKETALKEEMKSRCLEKGIYIDKKAEDKFKVLCRLEDFEVTYFMAQNQIEDLQQRIDKAIEYIENSRVDNNYMVQEKYEYLIEILGGKE